MSTTRYPAQSFESMSRKQAITTCYALEDMRDRALKRIDERDATLAKVAAIVADPDAALVVDRIRGVLEPTPKGKP